MLQLIGVILVCIISIIFQFYVRKALEPKFKWLRRIFLCGMLFHILYIILLITLLGVVR